MGPTTNESAGGKLLPAPPFVEAYITADGRNVVGSKTPEKFYVVVEKDGEVVYRSDVSYEREYAERSALARGAAVRRGGPPFDPVEIEDETVPPPGKRIPPKARLQALEGQHGGGLFPKPKVRKPKPASSAAAAKKEETVLPRYSEGISREPFDVRRGERIMLPRDGGVTPGGFLDPVSGVYRMAAHFYDGGYEMGDDEYEEIRGKARFVEADYRSSKNRWIFVARIEAFEDLEISNTGKGPRRILGYSEWVKEEGPLDEPPPKRTRRGGRRG